MSINTKLAKKALTKAEQNHLTECGVNSMASFERTRKAQIAMVKECEDKDLQHISEPCWDCKFIAGKLGME